MCAIFKIIIELLSRSENYDCLTVHWKVLFLMQRILNFFFFFHKRNNMDSFSGFGVNIREDSLKQTRRQLLCAGIESLEVQSISFNPEARERKRWVKRDAQPRKPRIKQKNGVACRLVYFLTTWVHLMEGK